jgi:hypothetical protein
MADLGAPITYDVKEEGQVLVNVIISFEFAH